MIDTVTRGLHKPIMTERDREFELMREQLDRMQGELQTMQGHLDTALRRTSPSLRESLRCPACGGTTILHAPEVLDRAEGGAREPLAIAQPSVWRSRTVGLLELYFCKRCGRAEWYVKDHAELQADGKTIREIDGSRGPGDGGYRSA